MYESSVLPMFNKHEFKTLDQVLIDATNDGDAINKAVEIYQKHNWLYGPKKENKNG